MQDRNCGAPYVSRPSQSNNLQPRWAGISLLWDLLLVMVRDLRFGTAVS
jgi:hypothetical protein